MNEKLQIRVSGDASLPTLVYLPGLHGDWTLIAGFREALNGRARLVELTYPRTLTWTIDDYANAIEQALLRQGINHGWLLGESFGSQPVWPFLAKNAASNQTPQTSTGTFFEVDGLILAAGFVRYPLPHVPLILHWIGGWRRFNTFRPMMRIFTWYRRLCHRLTPEARKDLDEFLVRRTDLDRQAMGHRLTLIHQYDPRSIARESPVPIYYLAGFFDLLVPWPVVRRWLRKNSPGYRGGKTIWLADHNVLSSAPAASASQILQWMQLTKPT